MKIEQFEKAIYELDHGIVIDEMKLRDGNVHACYGHTGCTLIMWDESGEGYTVEFDPEEGVIDSDTHGKILDRCYGRDYSFDLC